MDRSDWSSIFHAFDVRSHHNGYKPYVKGFQCNTKEISNKQVLTMALYVRQWKLEYQGLGRVRNHLTPIFDRQITISLAKLPKF